MSQKPSHNRKSDAHVVRRVLTQGTWRVNHRRRSCRVRLISPRLRSTARSSRTAPYLGLRPSQLPVPLLDRHWTALRIAVLSGGLPRGYPTAMTENGSVLDAEGPPVRIE